MSHLARRALAGLVLLALAAPAAAQAPQGTPQVIRIGVTPGPHAQIIEAVKPIAARRGLDLRIIEFSDFVIPNQALQAGEIEANSFQNQPYLDNQVKDRNLDIVSVALTVNFPLGIYSAKRKRWEDVPERGTIAIQNDPTNGGRSLLLLRDKGAIKLRDGVGFRPTVADIVENPRRLRFVEVDAAQTARSLADVDAASINTNFAVSAGIEPTSAILREEPKGPYVNLIAVRRADRDKPWVQALVESYHTPEVRDFVNRQFKGSVLPSW